MQSQLHDGIQSPDPGDSDLEIHLLECTTFVLLTIRRSDLRNDKFGRLAEAYYVHP